MPGTSASFNAENAAVENRRDPYEVLGVPRDASDQDIKTSYRKMALNISGQYMQEDSAKTGKVTSAGMYFLHFQVYRLDPTANTMAIARDPDAAFFKKLDGFQPCELSELKAGMHVFAVYGDNFFKSASYTIEAVCAEPFAEAKENLRDVEAKILSKRIELSKFETEYREIDELLKRRDAIHALYSSIPTLKRSFSGSKVKGSHRDAKGEAGGHNREAKQVTRDRSKKKWFNIHLKVDKRKAC